MRKSVGELIDELSIVNVKIFHLVDVVDQSEDEKEVAEAAKKLHKLNRRRVELKNALDSILDQGHEDIKV